MYKEWLDVPYGEKDVAKRAGARWDPTARRWYAPRPGMKELEKWKAKPPVPSVLPGEDRNFGSGLYVDLIPKSCWFTNVRNSVSEVDWKRIRRMVIERAGKRCEICGSSESLEAHERFEFDDAKQVQKLRRLICVCGPCHRTTHFGFAQLKGLGIEAAQHLTEVNGWDSSEASFHVNQAFEVWRRRSELEWSLDISMLDGARIHANATNTPSERNIQSELKTRAVRGTGWGSRFGHSWYGRIPRINL